MLEAKSDKQLHNKINKIFPEVIYLHVGQADQLNKTAGSKVVADLKDLINTLSTTTKAKICTSLMIPLEIIPEVKDTIVKVNKEIALFVTGLRKIEGGEKRFFTQSNNELGIFMRRSSGSHGEVISLSDRGQRKLWLNLRDGLSRCSEITTRQAQRTADAEQTKSNTQRSQINNEKINQHKQEN